MSNISLIVLIFVFFCTWFLAQYQIYTTHQLGFNLLIGSVEVKVICWINFAIRRILFCLFFIVGIFGVKRLTFLVDVYTNLRRCLNCPYLIYYLGHVSNAGMVSIYFGIELLQHFIEISSKLLQIFQMECTLLYRTQSFASLVTRIKDV